MYSSTVSTKPLQRALAKGDIHTLLRARVSGKVQVVLVGNVATFLWREEQE